MGLAAIRGVTSVDIAALQQRLDALKGNDRPKTLNTTSDQKENKREISCGKDPVQPGPEHKDATVASVSAATPAAPRGAEQHAETRIMTKEEILRKNQENIMYMRDATSYILELTKHCNDIVARRAGKNQKAAAEAGIGEITTNQTVHSTQRLVFVKPSQEPLPRSPFSTLQKEDSLQSEDSSGASRSVEATAAFAAAHDPTALSTMHQDLDRQNPVSVFSSPGGVPVAQRVVVDVKEFIKKHQGDVVEDLLDANWQGTSPQVRIIRPSDAEPENCEQIQKKGKEEESQWGIVSRCISALTFWKQ